MNGPDWLVALPQQVGRTPEPVRICSRADPGLTRTPETGGRDRRWFFWPQKWCKKLPSLWHLEVWSLPWSLPSFLSGRRWIPTWTKWRTGSLDCGTPASTQKKWEFSVRLMTPSWDCRWTCRSLGCSCLYPYALEVWLCWLSSQDWRGFICVCSSQVRKESVLSLAGCSCGCRGSPHWLLSLLWPIQPRQTSGMRVSRMWCHAGSTERPCSRDGLEVWLWSSGGLCSLSLFAWETSTRGHQVCRTARRWCTGWITTWRQRSYRFLIVIVCHLLHTHFIWRLVCQLLGLSEETMKWLVWDNSEVLFTGR